jgi:hypothetical protein
MKRIEILSTILIFLILFGYLFLPKGYEFISDILFFLGLIILVFIQNKEISKLRKRIDNLENSD